MTWISSHRMNPRHGTCYMILHRRTSCVKRLLIDRYQFSGQQVRSARKMMRHDTVYPIFVTNEPLPVHGGNRTASNIRSKSPVWSVGHQRVFHVNTLTRLRTDIFLSARATTWLTRVYYCTRDRRRPRCIVFSRITPDTKKPGEFYSSSDVARER